MRVLIDESLPRQLAPLLRGHDAKTVQEVGWSSVKNGELLRRAVVEGFEAFVTPDQNLEYQQNLSGVGLAVIVIRARSNRIEDIMPVVPLLLESLVSAQPGRVSHVNRRENR